MWNLTSRIVRAGAAAEHSLAFEAGQLLAQRLFWRA
jgi:hypothetical protein